MSAGFGHGQNLNLMPRILALHKLGMEIRAGRGDRLVQPPPQKFETASLVPGPRRWNFEHGRPRHEAQSRRRIERQASFISAMITP
jgi:hypothetical protein